MGVRFAIVIFAFFVGYSFLLFHLYEIQVNHNSYYLARADSQYAASGLLAAERGTIYFTDKNGNTLPAAINRDLPVIYANPKVIEEKNAPRMLAPILGQPESGLAEKLGRKSSYELLVKKASSETAKKVGDLNIKGVYVINAPSRFYPFGTLASQLLGFVAPNSTDLGESGRYGLEAFYNEKLSGVSGEVDGATVITPKKGEDVVLTIDPTIQTEAERILGNIVKKHNAKGGSVIVADPMTMKILALGNFPQFNPNTYDKADLSTFLNPVTQQIYEPGSVFKVITMAAGIDSGKITPDTSYVDTGSVTVNGRKIENYNLREHGPYGRVTMTNVIEHSINTGSVFAEKQIGRETFTKYVAKFGFGEKTDIDLPGELKGDIRRLNPKERDVAFATASYGQGVAVTPIELIRAIAAIANGGNLMKPYLRADEKPEVVRRVINASTAKKVTDMMVSGVDKAKIAKIDEFTLAGKTGTAFVPDFKKGGYTEEVINTYVGFGPTTNPKFIALIKLNEPQGAPVAGLSVVPAFRDLAQFILNYYNIVPDRLAQSTP